MQRAREQALAEWSSAQGATPEVRAALDTITFSDEQIASLPSAEPALVEAYALVLRTEWLQLAQEKARIEDRVFAVLDRELQTTTIRRTLILDEHRPNLLIRASDPKWDPLVRYFGRKRWQVFSNCRIDPASITVMSFYQDSEFSPRLEQLPPQSRSLPREADDLVKGRLESISDIEVENAMRAMRGKIVLGVFHVPNGSKAVEVTTADSQLHQYPLEKLLAVAKRNGVNFIPLGCRSAEAANVGVEGKVRSLDVLAAIENVVTARPTSAGELFGSLSEKLPDMSEPIPFSFSLDAMGPDWAEVEVPVEDHVEPVVFRFDAGDGGSPAEPPSSPAVAGGRHSGRGASFAKEVVGVPAGVVVALPATLRLLGRRKELDKHGLGLSLIMAVPGGCFAWSITENSWLLEYVITAGTACASYWLARTVALSLKSCMWTPFYIVSVLACIIDLVHLFYL